MTFLFLTKCIAFIFLVLPYASGFVATRSLLCQQCKCHRSRCNTRFNYASPVMKAPRISVSNTNLKFVLADGGLDPDTLQALGEVTELNDALDGAISAGNPAAGLLTNLVASQFIILVPITAGLLVAFGIGYFIFSYGSGRE